MNRTPDEVKHKRAEYLRPLFEALAERGVQKLWLANRLGIGKSRLWMYENGYDRIPPDFIVRAVRACKEAGFTPVIPAIPIPRDLYVQAAKRKGAPHDSSEHNTTSSGRARRAQPTTPPSRRNANSSAPDAHL